MTAPGGVVLGGLLQRGVSAPGGVSALRGLGVCSRGGWGVCSWGGGACWSPPPGTATAASGTHHTECILVHDVLELKFKYFGKAGLWILFISLFPLIFDFGHHNASYKENQEYIKNILVVIRIILPRIPGSMALFRPPLSL